MRAVLPLLHRRPHPLAQVLSLIVGVLAFGVLMVFGLVIVGVLALGGALWMGWRQWKRNRMAMPGTDREARQSQVLEGEYVVIRGSQPGARR